MNVPTLFSRGGNFLIRGTDLSTAKRADVNILAIENTKNILNSSELTINKIFKFRYWSGVSSSNRTRLENAFIYNRITSLTDCFRVRECYKFKWIASSAQWIIFSNIFPISGVAYNSLLYDSGPKFKTAFYGFTSSYVTFEPLKTLCSSVNNNNYGTTSYTH